MSEGMIRFEVFTVDEGEGEPALIMQMTDTDDEENRLVMILTPEQAVMLTDEIRMVAEKLQEARRDVS